MISDLHSPVPPWILKSVSDKVDLGQLKLTLSECGAEVRILDGGRMRTIDALFNEFSSQLDFPSYFGRNWDALDECLADLNWLPGSAYVLLIEHARYTLDNEPPSQLETFFRIIECVAKEWATPVNNYEFWDRPEIAFHLVLHEVPDHFPALTVLLQKSGINVPDLT